MNSKQLKTNHKNVYENFFGEHSIIVSAPFLMTWAGDLSKFYSGITIKQKIPLRMYMGIKINKNQNIAFKNIIYFDKKNNDFVKSSLGEHMPLFYHLQQYLEKHRSFLCEKYGGIEINILSELSRGVGLGFESIFSFLLSTLLHRLAGNISHEDLVKINALSIENAIKNSSSEIRNWLKEGIIFDELILGSAISGTKKSSFFDSYYPIISISKDLNSDKKDVQLSLDKGYAFRMNELFPNLNPIPYLPVDYGIIYSGKPVFLEKIITKHKKDTIYLNGIKPYFKELFHKYFSSFPKNEIPKFYKNFIAIENDEPEDILYGNLIGLSSIRILYYLSKLYGSEYNEDNVRFFIDAIKKYRRCDYVSKESSSDYVEIIKELTEHCNIFSKYIGLFPNDTTIMGGTIGFVLPLESYRKDICNSIVETEKSFPGVDLIYASWIDGIEYEGLKFEQDIFVNIFSSFLNTEKCILKDTEGNYIFGNYEELISMQGNDVLLDCISNKLYIKNKKITSEQLHSQSTTIDILQILIENMGKEVYSNQLPPSSYSKNKNAMLSKIVIPFVKLIKKEFGQNFPLICKGMLYDFYMKLDKSTIKIGIIEKNNSLKKE